LEAPIPGSEVGSGPGVGAGRFDVFVPSWGDPLEAATFGDDDTMGSDLEFPNDWKSRRVM
jgi:hypothetical protein